VTEVVRTGKCKSRQRGDEKETFLIFNPHGTWVESFWAFFLFFFKKKEIEVWFCFLIFPLPEWKGTVGTKGMRGYLHLENICKKRHVCFGV
jgi:hypothetical protein